MAKKLYIGNLPWKTTQEDLQTMFGEYGAVEDAVVITDRMSGRSKGFGFVTFTEDADADAAITAMDGKEMEGRELKVNEARPRED